jgi:hypothetical protein
MKKESKTILTGYKQQTLVTSAVRRLAKMGYTNDGGYGGIDSGWFRITRDKKSLQFSYRIDNEGEIHMSVHFYKF